jgi:hypothetical protein
MKIIGCDFYARQQIHRHVGSRHGRSRRADVDPRRGSRTGILRGAFRPVVVGLEATGSMGWFLRPMDDLGITYRVGHPASIRKAETRKQKHDRRDAALLLQLLVEDRFPAIWMPSSELRDVRALLLHRHQWVRMRTRVMNALPGLALGHGVWRGAALWSGEGQATVAALALRPHAGQQRTELQAMYGHLNTQIKELDQRVTDQATSVRSPSAQDAFRCRTGHSGGYRSVSG